MDTGATAFTSHGRIKFDKVDLHSAYRWPPTDDGLANTTGYMLQKIGSRCHLLLCQGIDFGIVHRVGYIVAGHGFGHIYLHAQA